jgi:oligoribonuclease NrnB/cAMP/cGMP phosphodiesterase (DHH superfamily)
MNLSTFNFKHNYTELENTYNFDEKNITKNKHKINYVVTHGGCSDGFMSATIVWKWLKDNKVDVNNVTFYNAYHGNDFSKLPDFMKDKYVLICDFSFTEVLFNQMIETTNGNILVLDHHKTAQINLKNIPKQYLTFDMAHSGAFITWIYMYGFSHVPKAILYVEDNDIWTKCLPNTREFTAFMFNQKFNFEQYDLFFDEDYLTNIVFQTGSGMVLQNNTYIESLSKKAIPHFMLIDGRYYYVACLNSSVLKSELGNNVFSVLKHSNFSMIYSHDMYSNSTSISYRSLDDKTDTTEIAKLNKGGGHRNASGAGLPYIVTHPPGKVIDFYRSYGLLDTLYVKEHNGKKYIVVNTPISQKHITQYLIQERFFGSESLLKNKTRYDQNLVGYQEGMYCMRNRTENNNLDESYNGAIAWGYDGMKKEYKITVALLSNTIVGEIIKYLDVYKALNNWFEWKSHGRNTFSFNLPVDTDTIDDFINNSVNI